MKLVKMSLAAAMLMGASAFAIDNVKVSGDAKLYYSTADANDASLFSKEGAAGQAAASLSISADLTEGISAGTKVTALSTLGLEGQLVNAVWEAPNNLTDSYIVNDLWLAGTIGNTTGKIGRMELDTPLVFTEKWSIVENTFESAVVINQDIPDTTLVGAYVGGSNGQLVRGLPGTPAAGGGIGSVVQGETANSTFAQFYNGAFAAGVVNNSWAPLTVQAWYYDATHVAQAYWVSADLNMEGILLGAQYTGTDLQDSGLANDAGTAYAVMAGYEMKDTFTAKVAYSGTSTDAGAGFNLAGTGQSKLYTEAWWNYGYITQADTSTINVTLEAPIKDIVDLGLYYTMADQSTDAGDNDMNELTLSVSKTVGPLDVALVYVNTAAEDQNNADAYNTVQAYLTYNF